MTFIGSKLASILSHVCYALPKECLHVFNLVMDCKRIRILLLVVLLNTIQEFVSLYIIFFLGAVVNHSVSYICKKINSASHGTAQPTHDTPESNNFTLGDFVRWFHCFFCCQGFHTCAMHSRRSVCTFLIHSRSSN
jgi:hypothetical protein